MIIYADNLSDIASPPARLPSQSRRSVHHGPVSCRPIPAPCGIAELDSEGRIISFTEKPEHPATDLANAGLYVVDGALYREMPGKERSTLGFDVLPRLVGRMRGWVWGGYHLDIGTPEALEQARSDAPRFFAGRQVAGAGPRPAVFLDRDGTLIKHVHYLSDPAHVGSCPGRPRRSRSCAWRAFAAFWSPTNPRSAGA